MDTKDVQAVTTGANPAIHGMLNNNNGSYTSPYAPLLIGTDTVTVSTGGQELTHVQTTVAAGVTDAAEASLAASPSGLFANGADLLTLTLTLRDRNSNLKAGLPAGQIQLAADPAAGCTITPFADGSQTDANGAISTTVTATTPQAYTFSATVEGVALQTKPQVTFYRAVDAGQSSVSVTPTRIAADGAQQAQLTWTLKDKDGNAAVGIPAELRNLGLPSGVGQVSAGGATDGEGRFTDTVTASQVGKHEVGLTVGGVALPKATVDARTFVDLLLKPGGNFFGIPLTPADEGVPDGLVSGAARLARYGDTGAGRAYLPYVPGRSAASEFTCRAGLGRFGWLDGSADLTVRFLGDPVPLTPFEATLETGGWTALGNPYDMPFTWDPAKIRVKRDGTDLGSLKELFDSGTVWQTVLPYAWLRQAGGNILVFDPSVPGFGKATATVPRLAGLWAKAQVAGVSLVLPAPSGSGRASPTSPGPKDWTVRLAAGQDGGQADALVGVSSGLTRAVPLEGPPDMADSPVTLNVITSTGRCLGELRPWRSGSESWDLEAVTRGEGEVTLSWPSLLRELPRGLLLTLTDQTTGEAVLLNTHGGYRYTPSRAGETRALRLEARFGHLQRSSITGLTASPTRGRSVALSLTVSGPAEVTLTVRGLGGRVVKRLTQTAEAAGTVQVAWDGTDQSGRRVPAGSYLIEATALSPNGALSRATRTVTVR